MKFRAQATAVAIAVAGAGISAGLASTPSPAAARAGVAPIKHVLLISVDGLHQTDLTYYARTHPTSELARIYAGGDAFANARTPVPSDSFPGMVGQVTGGTPGTTGVYYDDSANQALDAPGTTDCATATPGTAVNLDESLDTGWDGDDSHLTIDAGQGLSGLPGSILSMTGHPQSLLNPAEEPVDPSTCKPVAPWNYLKVNTVFGVLHAAHRVTAWADKHPAYAILSGPGDGNNIDDLFTPEINAPALKPDGSAWPDGIDYTGDNAATQQYDTYKVDAVLNWIKGLDHQGTGHLGVPALFGMNFQTVSTAEKLYSSPSTGRKGGYLDNGTVPGKLLVGALNYVNAQMTRIVAGLRAAGLSTSTAIILSAKHGQSPEDTSDLVRIDDGPIIDGLNKAWAAADPAWESAHNNAPLWLGGTDDDGIMWWLNDRAPAATRFAYQYLWSHSATGVNYANQKVTLPHSGLIRAYYGASADRYFKVPDSDTHHPDVFGVVKVGVVYTTGTKIAEHGGANPDDRDVPLVVYAPGHVTRARHTATVFTYQIAPTILRLLSLSPNALEAVRIDHTQVLPGA